MRIEAIAFRSEFARRPFATPLRLASGTIADITEATVTVELEIDGVRAIGRGAILLSDLWAWPDPAIPSIERDAAMREYLDRAGSRLTEWCAGSEHPLEISARLHAGCLADRSSVPPLARLVSTSPLDAAIHDAAGRAKRCSSFALHASPVPCPSIDPRFPATGAVAAVSDLLGAPRNRDPAASVVIGKGEDPAMLDHWTGERGVGVFKLKIGGIDPDEDAQRCAAVVDRARILGCAHPRISVDANCMTPDARTVVTFLDALEVQRPDVLAAIDSIEQPTHRDIVAHPFDWHPVARRIPLLLDEGWVDWESLAAAERQGWNGLAVKTCKGHGFALCAAAWAHQRGWHLRMMDLTNPGIAAIHALRFASHLPDVDWVELNAVQYLPSGHDGLDAAWRQALEPIDGIHHLPNPGIGLETFP
ncbi:MAG: enolase C-terminal domain-like protein [Armatimonadota bacterium]